jgi:steroid 5-alpha reductase family enzyme
MGAVFLATAIALSLWMVVAWCIQRQTANAGVVDVMWAMGLGLAALYFGLVGDGSMMARLMVAMLAGVWATRLAMHLLVRLLYEDEDARYRALRLAWGERANRNFFWLFQARALMALGFAVPLWIAAQNPEPAPALWTLAAVAVWTVAVLGESLSDYQLARFRVQPSNRGKTLRAGLWRHSRHPNYFFESLHWCAYALLAVGAPLGWLAWLGPLLMLLLLYRVTGIPAAERQAIRARGQCYRDYQRVTSTLLLWPPRVGSDVPDAEPS